MHFYSWSDYSTTTRLLNYHHYYSTTTTTTIIAYWLLKFLTIISLYYKSNPTSSFNTGTVGTVTFFVFKKLCLNQSTAQFKNALNAYSHYLLVTSLLFLPLPNKYCSPVGRRFAPAPPHAAFDTFLLCRTSSTFANNKFDGYHLKICSTPVSFGPASPDAGVELLRQLFLQCTRGSKIL